VAVTDVLEDRVFAFRSRAVTPASLPEAVKIGVSGAERVDQPEPRTMGHSAPERP
jgi:hypothetical protein